MKITEISGTGIPVEGNDIDTDRIIPARYLKEITFTNMGKYAFYDERHDSKGELRPHPFNDHKYDGAKILIVNKNFGCGSSREHAPQAILRHGIKAVVGESFAEIFAGNCTMLGAPTVTMDEREVIDLMAAVRANPGTSIRLSLVHRTVTYSGKTVPIHIADVVQKALTEGTWDSTRLMLENMEKVRTTAGRIPYLNRFQAAEG